jgi:hypothetical protein
MCNQTHQHDRYGNRNVGKVTPDPVVLWELYVSPSMRRHLNLSAYAEDHALTVPVALVDLIVGNNGMHVGIYDPTLRGLQDDLVVRVWGQADNGSIDATSSAVSVWARLCNTEATVGYDADNDHFVWQWPLVGPTKGGTPGFEDLDTMPPTFGSEAAFVRWLNDTHGDGRQPWHSWGEDDWSGDFYHIAIGFAQPQEPDAVDALVGYWATGVFAGEYDRGCAEPDYGNRLVGMFVDATKSRRDDYGDAMDALWTILDEGTPVRTTDRAGAGTKGTQKYPGVVGAFWVAFS